jgi:hypothetical protein
VEALARVRTLIEAGESVMVVQDASHLFNHTLEIMRGSNSITNNGLNNNLNTRKRSLLGPRRAHANCC